MSLRSCGARHERAVLPFGIKAIDERLPEGGLALGALHEMAGGGDRRVGVSVLPSTPLPVLGIGRARWSLETGAMPQGCAGADARLC
jgi:protein ImuA